eukprot:2127876-Prymnesium_polylepis.1
MWALVFNSFAVGASAMVLQRGVSAMVLKRVSSHSGLALITYGYHSASAHEYASFSGGSAHRRLHHAWAVCHEQGGQPAHGDESHPDTCPDGQHTTSPEPILIYVSLGGVLIWIPEWATRVSSRATLQRWVRRPKAPMPPAVLDSSPIPNAAEQEAPANAPTNFRSKCKQEIKHHLLMIAVTACVCIPLGLWDSMAVADLLNQARFCRTRLQELAWAGPA